MASLDNSREQEHTYLKKQTASDGRLLSMAKKVERIGNLASAFDQLIGSGQRDEYAIALLAACAHVVRQALLDPRSPK